LPGQWPKTEPKVFERSGAVTLFDQAPPAAEIDANYTPIK
jgi:hypothetical protein